MQPILKYPYDKKATGANIRTERKRKGWTLDKTARIAGVTISTLSAIETGRKGAQIATFVLI